MEAAMMPLAPHNTSVTLPGDLSQSVRPAQVILRKGSEARIEQMELEKEGKKRGCGKVGELVKRWFKRGAGKGV
jgi:hypothetical protein